MRNSDEKNRQSIEDAVELVSEAIADIFERVGLRRVLGRLWATLYLSPEPIDAEDLQFRLGVSTGTLSTSLNELIGLGLVVRETTRGERRFYYRAEKEMWSLVTRIFKERERQRLTESLNKLKSAEILLAGISGSGALETEVAQRLQHVQHLVEVGSFIVDFLDAFVERTRLELKAAQKWLFVSGKLGSEPLSRLRKKISFGRRDKPRLPK